MNELKELKELKEFITTPFLTTNEQTRIISTRATEICNGADANVDVGNLTRPIDIALKELEEGVIPYLIKRPLSNDGKLYEIREINDLIKK